MNTFKMSHSLITLCEFAAEVRNPLTNQVLPLLHNQVLDINFLPCTFLWLTILRNPFTITVSVSH